MVVSKWRDADYTFFQDTFIVCKALQVSKEQIGKSKQSTTDIQD